jgi:hypothetical protein
MKSHLLALALLASLAPPPFAGAADAPGSLPVPALPDALRVGAGEELLLVAKAQGVQTYECRARKDDSTQYEWAFTGPEADLFDSAGSKIGRHYAGPTWELSDGSRVTGTVRATVPSTEPGAVPWLLLAAKSHAGDGRLGQVSSIQRLETVGGKAPAGGCTQATLGQKLRVPYRAVYCFYVRKP